LEGLGVQNKGTIAVIEHSFNDEIDKQFKPGLYKQVEAFMNNDLSRLMNMEEHIYISKAIYQTVLA